MNIVRAAYRWTAEEMETALRRHMSATDVTQSMNVTKYLVGAVCTGALLFAIGDARDGFLAVFRILLLAMFQFFSRLAIPRVLGMAESARALRAVRREWNRSPLADHVIEWEVSGGEVKFYQRGLFYTARTWKGFEKFTEVGDGFLLYPSGRGFHWLPFHAFENTLAVDEVREMIVASGVPFKKIST